MVRNLKNPFTSWLHWAVCFCIVILFASCKEQVTANDDQIAKIETGISIPVPKVYSANKSSFSVDINCPNTVKRIEVSGSVQTTIHCQDQPFTVGLDLTWVPDGLVNLVFSPNNGPQVKYEYFKDVLPPNITGLVSDIIPASTKTWTWGCSDGIGLCTYRYVITKSPVYIFTIEPFVATTTASRLKGNGTYFLHIQSKDSQGNISDTTSVSAVISNPTAPTLLIEKIGSTEIFDYFGEATLQLFVNPLYNEMYITNTPGCGSDGVWETYSPVKYWPLNPTQKGGVATVFAKFRTPGGVETPCISDSANWKTDLRVCVDTSTTATSGNVFDDGGPYGNYSDNKMLCNLNFNAAGSYKFKVNGLNLKNGDQVYFFGSVKSHYFAGKADGSLTFGTRINNEWTTTTIASAKGMVLEFAPQTIYMDVYYDASLNDQGFDVSWETNASIPLSSGTDGGSFVINNGDPTTTSRQVTLSLDYANLSEMYVTADPSCNIGGEWEDTESTKAWSLPATEGKHEVFVKFRDSYLHESLCEGSSIYLDLTAPSAPIITFMSLATVPTSSPNLYFIEADAVTGVNRTEARIVRAFDNAVIVPWTTLLNGDKLTGLSLSTGVDYYFELRSVDQAGNLSSITQSTIWSIRPSVSLAALSNTLINENVGTVTFRISSSTAVGGPMPVHFKLTGEATAPDDHNLITTQAVIPTGQSHVDVTVSIVDDAISESGERLRISLTTPQTTSYSVDFNNQLEYYILANDGATSLPTVTTMGLGSKHSCALLNGGVQCWGWSNSGNVGDGTTIQRMSPVQTIPAASGVTDLDVSANDFTCAVVSGGVRCWGYNNQGQLGDNSITNRTSPVQPIAAGSSVTDIAVGHQHTCAVVNGGVRCWGYNAWGALGDNSQTQRRTPVQTIPDSSGVTKVGAGAEHSCAIVNGGLKCWGDNYYGGQLGDGGILSETLVPMWVIPASSGVTDLAVGTYYNCIVINGGLTCWGQNTSGQLGDGTLVTKKVPTQILPPGSGVTAVFADTNTTCMIQNGDFKCWGSNAKMQIESSSTTNILTPVTVAAASRSPISGVVGTGNICTIFTEGVECAGDNGTNQRASGESTWEVSPIQIYPPGSGVTDVSAGYVSTCVTVNGALQCFGSPGAKGKMGDGTRAAKSTAVTVMNAGTNPSAIVAGRYRAFASVGGGLQAWGENMNYLGDGTSTDRLSPISIIAPGSSVSKVSSFDVFTCAVVSAGVKCWGSNFYGELGLGFSTGSPSNTPQQTIAANSAVTDVSVGEGHACAVVNGGVKCWGFNTQYQVGDNSVTQRNAPVNTIAALSGATAVGVGQDHSCAIVNGGVKCWGLNTSRQLGDNTAVNKTTPTDIIPASSGVTQVGGGAVHSCALANGGVQCWGTNYFGQVGDGTMTTRGTPVTVIPANSGATKLSVGPYHNCVVISGGLQCWGNAAAGHLGNGYMLSDRNWVHGLIP